MTMEKIIRRNKIISRYLLAIKNYSEQFESNSLLRSVSPQFREVHTAQEHLLNAVESLLEKYPENRLEPGRTTVSGAALMHKRNNGESYE